MLTAFDPLPSGPSDSPRAVRVTRFDRRLHRSYRQLFAVRRWTWGHLTPGGALVLWAIVAAGSFTDVPQTMSHYLLAFLGCVFGLSALCLFGRRPRLEIERHLPRHASAGTAIRCRIRLRNLTPRWQRGLEYQEGTPDPRPTVEQFASLEEPAEASRNWFDRRYRFYRWRWLCARNTCASPEPVPIPDLPPGGTVELTLEVMPLRRGRLTLVGAQAVRLDPFRLVRRATAIRDEAVSVIVYPRRFILPAIPLPGLSQRLHTGGVALAGAVGESEEFVAVREYRPGDPPRRFHWAGWARTQRPVVKEYQEEYFVRHAMFLDTFGGGRETEALEDAVSLAASFACTVDEQDSLLDLMFVGKQAYVFTAGRGIAHSAQMLEILAGVELQPDGDPESLQELVFRHVRQFSGCILILLHWDDVRKALRERLEARQVATLTFIIREDPRPPGMELPAHTHWIRAGEMEKALRDLPV